MINKETIFKIKLKGEINMKKKIFGIIALAISMFGLVGCQTEAERVSYNLSQEADNFNVIRRLTVIDCITGDTLFQMEGRISIQPDNTDHQLEIISEENGYHKKHFVGLSDNVSYTVEQLDVKDVDKYKFTINYNPKMWIPVTFENID